MPPKKRAYHHGDLRRTLLDASIALIVERGLDQLSLREVARRAGVSPAAPYHHFATRQELLEALAVEGFVMLAESMRASLEAVADQGSVERFRATGVGYIRFALAHPAHFRLMFRPSLVPVSAVASSAKGAAQADSFQILLDAVDDTLKDQSIRAHLDRRGLALVAWSLVHGAAELLLDGPFALGLPELDAPAPAIPELVTRAFQGLLDALRDAKGAGEGARVKSAKRRRTT
jgi:AcrR family transcriptional regulator